MRLIDVSKLKKIRIEHQRSVYSHGRIEGYNACIEDLENQPEVKAIPIEWLHSIMERQIIFAMNSEMEGTTTVKDGVIHCVSGALACQVLANVIKLWEKENGRD